MPNPLAPAHIHPCALLSGVNCPGRPAATVFSYNVLPFCFLGAFVNLVLREYVPRVQSFHVCSTMILNRIIGLIGLLSVGSAYTTLSDETLRNLPGPGDDFDINKGAILAPILQTRVPGTPGSTAVLNHFVNFFQQSLPKWKLIFQNSTARTPLSGESEIPFVNLIATRDPPWASDGEVGRLALVAHYDSKLDPPGFLGAIDSAAPCAMIMHVARSIDDALTRKWAAMEAEGVGAGGFGGVEEDSGIQILLLDGEEAFKVWSHTDSIYGARYEDSLGFMCCEITDND